MEKQQIRFLPTIEEGENMGRTSQKGWTPATTIKPLMIILSCQMIPEETRRQEVESTAREWTAHRQQLRANGFVYLRPSGC